MIIFIFIILIIFTLLLLVYLTNPIDRIIEYYIKDKDYTLLFYKGFPKYGYYVNCLKKCEKIGKNILINNLILKNSAVIFDFDDTLIYTHKQPDLLYDDEYKCFFNYYIPIQQICNLFKYAQKLGYITFIITSRNQNLYYDTLSNCKKINCIPSFLYMTNNKLKLRLKLNVTYNLHLIIGDQFDDIYLAPFYAIKLPDIYDMNSYLYHNNKELLL